VKKSHDNSAEVW